MPNVTIRSASPLLDDLKLTNYPEMISIMFVFMPPRRPSEPRQGTDNVTATV